MPHHSELVEIPGTEIELSRYSLGTAPLSGLFKKVSEQESDLVVQCALNSGMNYFDLPLPSDLWEKMEGAGLIEPILSL